MKSCLNPAVRQWLLRAVCTAAGFMLGVAPVQARLLTEADRPLTGAVVVDFSNLGRPTAAGQVLLDVPGGVARVQAINGALRQGAGPSGWALGSNGQWTGPNPFIGVDGGADTVAQIYAALVVDFGYLRVSSIGADLNFNPDFTYGAGFPLPLYLAAYDTRGQLLESFEVDIRTPGAVNAGRFLGLGGYDEPLISRFEVSGPYAVMDNLSFTTPVPHAPGWALSVAGVCVLAWARRRGLVKAP